MKDLLIFGINKFAIRVKHLVDVSGEYRVVSFVLDREYLSGANQTIEGIPVTPFDSINKFYPPEKTEMIFAVGYKKMNTIRKNSMKAAINQGYSIANYIHPTALVQSSHMGVGNIILENVIIGNNSCIGDGNIFFPAANVSHDTIVGNYNFFAVSSVVSGDVIIGNQCFFGANSTIRNSVKISDATLVGAGAYVSDNTEEKSVYVPVRSFKLEDKDSFEIDL